ncbi:MAG: RsmB/NOP family class I SAM-dependent RNA methyltransferase [Bacteroidetes bacterium]|nr:RsmB/NOP family class I SAM-dependent RNA methyltransferase [Bacteroidota bacterium]
MRKTKSVHRGPASISLLKEALEYYYHKGFTADRALNETFRHYKLRDDRLRGELADRLYGIIRFRRPLVSALGYERIDTIDDVKLLVELWNVWKKIYEGKEYKGETNSAKEKLKKYLRVHKMKESYPDWMDEAGRKELGDEKWEKISSALNRQPRLFIRANTLRTTRDQLIGRLKEEGVRASPVNESEEAVLVEEFYNVYSLPSFHEGLFEVQDLSSMRVSSFLDVSPGMRVLDACAGNGGKTLHLAALIKNKGKIIATDVSQRKLDELRSRCKRNGVDVVETMLIRKETDLSSLKGTFDRVLLDVPCSGTGVLKRNPDIKWRILPEDLQELQLQQKKILETYAALLKKDGKLVYACCSVLPSEGETRVNSFLEDHLHVKEEELRLDPDFGDGFYMARIK